jgi:hypothetical protein
VQFNDVPVAWWCEERVGTSDDEKKFLMGIVTADRNKYLRTEQKSVSTMNLGRMPSTKPTAETSPTTTAEATVQLHQCTMTGI